MKASFRVVVAALVASFATAVLSLVFSLLVDLASQLFFACPMLAWVLPVAGLLSLALYRIAHIPFRTATTDVLAWVKAGVPAPVSLAPSIILGTCATVLCGGSVGKEAAALQAGVAVSSKVCDLASVGEERRGLLASCGIASALSVLLGAPIAGALFAVELAGYRLRSAFDACLVLVSGFVAKGLAWAVAADSLSHSIAVPAWGAGEAGLAVALVACEALVAALFCYGLRAGKMLTGRSKAPAWIWLVGGGLVVAALLWGTGSFEYAGTGMTYAVRALDGAVDSPYFLGKLLLTMVALACGLKGGEIMPVLCIGATAGCFFGQSLGLEPSFCAALGLVALLSACTNCPLTALALACESFGLAGFGWYAAAAAIAFAGTSWFSLYGNVGVFEACARRLKRLRTTAPPPSGRTSLRGR